MPGTKWKRSLRAPGTYERMPASWSKGKRARLSNWMAKKGYKVRQTKSGPKRKVRRRGRTNSRS